MKGYNNNHHPLSFNSIASLLEIAGYNDISITEHEQGSYSIIGHLDHIHIIVIINTTGKSQSRVLLVPYGKVGRLNFNKKTYRYDGNSTYTKWLYKILDNSLVINEKCKRSDNKKINFLSLIANAIKYK
jgi:hypothetical protein